MRISDWSSDVCSSDLLGQHRPDLRVAEAEPRRLRAHTRHSAGDAHGPPGSVRLRAPAADVHGPAPDPVRRPALGAGPAGPASPGDRQAHRGRLRLHMHGAFPAALLRPPTGPGPGSLPPKLTGVLTRR